MSKNSIVVGPYPCLVYLEIEQKSESIYFNHQFYSLAILVNITNTALCWSKEVSINSLQEKRKNLREFSRPSNLHHTNTFSLTLQPRSQLSTDTDTDTDTDKKCNRLSFFKMLHVSPWLSLALLLMSGCVFDMTSSFQPTSRTPAATATTTTTYRGVGVQRRIHTSTSSTIPAPSSSSLRMSMDVGNIARFTQL